MGGGEDLSNSHSVTNLPLFRLPPALPCRCLGAQSQLGTLPVTLTTYYALLHSIQTPFPSHFANSFSERCLQGVKTPVWLPVC